MVVCVYVRDPDTGKPAYNLFDLSRPKAAGELAEGALAAVQQHAPSLESIDVDGGHVAILGGHSSSCAQEHHLQLFFSCLLAHTGLSHTPHVWSHCVQDWP